MTLEDIFIGAFQVLIEHWKVSMKNAAVFPFEFHTVRLDIYRPDGEFYFFFGKHFQQITISYSTGIFERLICIKREVVFPFMTVVSVFLAKNQQTAMHGTRFGENVLTSLTSFAEDTFQLYIFSLVTNASWYHVIYCPKTYVRRYINDS